MCMSTGMGYICAKHGYPTMRCPVSWGHLSDTCFTVNTGKKTWTEAKNYCASTGAELLTFDSGQEQSTHIGWIRFQIENKPRIQNTTGKIWTGLSYSLPMPSWMKLNPPESGGSTLCIGMLYNATRGVGYWEGTLEAVSCNEKNVFACQHRNPDHWP
ncbi:killer cell lectin-like receptor subfamily B member 1B allele B [Pecten maximus]|uniref:killer cell lectin-like receptor subfamily B member 1B allele B n=1 Tax=Pecten maximus TaxID=6579 RepID=UPI0014583BBA|nr:killer cell lectin-like receptor subfamily B member 1B allele B [Pecten maximus]